MKNKTIAIEFAERLEQLIKDGKGEVQAFDITAYEFEFKIMDFNLNPLKYVFIDKSICEFREGAIYFSL